MRQQLVGDLAQQLLPLLGGQGLQNPGGIASCHGRATAVCCSLGAPACRGLAGLLLQRLLQDVLGSVLVKESARQLACRGKAEPSV